jgi:hypothetical protein
MRTKHEMSWTTDSVARCLENDDQPTHGDQELEDQLTQEQFKGELEKDLAVMLTQDDLDEEPDEEQGGAEGREGEAPKREEEQEEDDEADDDEDSEEGYESPKDPFPHEPRHRPTEDELDKDFDPNEEVQRKP